MSNSGVSQTVSHQTTSSCKESSSSHHSQQRTDLSFLGISTSPNELINLVKLVTSQHSCQVTKETSLPKEARTFPRVVIHHHIPHGIVSSKERFLLAHTKITEHVSIVHEGKGTSACFHTSHIELSSSMQISTKSTTVDICQITKLELRGIEGVVIPCELHSTTFKGIRQILFTKHLDKVSLATHRLQSRGQLCQTELGTLSSHQRVHHRDTLQWLDQG